MGKLLGLLGGWQGYLALALACILAGSFGTWRIMSWREGAQQKTVYEHRIITDEHRGKITFDVGMHFEQARIKFADDTEKRQEEVAIHVTPQMDNDFPVPCGFVRVFNAAAHGQVPDPAACPDDAPSTITLSTVGHTETENGGQYDQISAQLIALQDWVRQQQGVK